MVASLQPHTRLWRLVLLVSCLCTAFGAFQWLSDPLTSQVALTQSLLNHWWFGANCVAMLALFVGGVHNRVIAPQM